MKFLTLLVAFTLVCFALSPTSHAVVPAPDGGYPGFNTAEGDNALLNLTTGTANAAIGWMSLRGNTGGNLNTGVGAGTLLSNTVDNNTAVGAAALLFNTTGADNTGVGVAALIDNTIGSFNTATGFEALFSNITGQFNTADGFGALDLNTVGNANTAIGASALQSNTEGDDNTAVGANALDQNSTGNRNTVIGSGAGSNIVTANNVICIGEGLNGEDVSDSCYINNIFNATSSNGIGVLVNGNGKLGTTTSSRRFKDEIKPMDQASEALFALKPVRFRYKKEIDPAGTSQLGLVAEDVERVNPDLVVRDKEGKPYSVRYDQVNAMLLNEFLKEHRTVEEQGRKLQEQETTIAQQRKDFEATISELKKGMETLAMRSKEQDVKIQKVSDQNELKAAAKQLAVSK
jgi:hypothetical protein